MVARDEEVVAFTRELDHVVVISADGGGGKMEQIGFGTLVAQAARSAGSHGHGSAVQRAQVLAGCKGAAEACATRAGVVAVGTLADSAAKSGAPAAGTAAVAKSLGVGKAVSAGFGAVTSIAVAPLALGAFEWWRHGQFVAEEKPKLRARIDISLRDFIEGALAR